MADFDFERALAQRKRDREVHRDQRRDARLPTAPPDHEPRLANRRARQEFAARALAVELEPLRGHDRQREHGCERRV